MLSGTGSAEDTDSVEEMARHEEEMEAEKWIMTQKFPCACQPSSYSDLRQARWMNYDKLQDAYHGRMLDLGKRRRKKTKNQPQHCPSCHCPPDVTRNSTGRPKYYKNVESLLTEYQGWLDDPENQSFKKTQSNLQSCRFSTCNHDQPNSHTLRRKQTNSHRRQARNEEDPMMLHMMTHGLNLDENDNCDVCYRRGQSIKNRCKTDAPWRDEQVIKNVSVDRDTASRCMQNKKEQAESKLNANEKYELEGRENEEFCQARRTWNLHDSRHEDTKRRIESKSPGSNRKEIGAPGTTYNSRTYDLQSSIKNKNIGDTEENRGSYKLRKRSSTRQDSPCRLDEDPGVNRLEKIVEDTNCELISQNGNEETHLHRKNVYAGGDLDLHTHKNDMIGLIERVIGNKFGSTMEQQQNAESNGGVTDQEISTEITRVLQTDHQESKANGISHLKELRWAQMKHIQNEFTKLCNLQEFLDSYSPRQSIEQHAEAVDTRTEDRQRWQHEEKQKLGMIS